MTRRYALIALVFALLSVRLWSQQPAPTQPAPVVEVPGTIPTPATEDRPSQSAVPVKEVPSPAAPSNGQEAIGWGLGAALLVEYLKKKKWFTFLNDDSSEKAKAIFGFLSALFTTAGIQFAVSGSIFDAGGASVTATGITLVGVKDVLFQWIVQQGWYLALIKPTGSASLRRVP